MTLAAAFSADRPLVLVGAGKMGGALLEGWLAGGLSPEAAVVVDPAPPEESRAFLARAGVAIHSAPPPAKVARLLVLAVKPQILDSVLPALRPLVAPDTIVLSIAAGKTIAGIARGLGDLAVVRAMPNTPAQVGRGITAATGNLRVGEAERRLTTALLEAVGDVVWVDDERQIDAVTAVSGSGPAYVFLLAEALAEAARAEGLSDDAAERLARATVTGAGELLHRSPHPPAKLRENVTSPKGTTAAALSVLMAEDGLSPLMKRAVAAARRRAEELSG